MHLDRDIDESDSESYPTGVSYIDTSSQLNTSFCSTENINSISCTNDASPETGISINTDLIFRSRGLHLCNLNISHLVPKLEELRISMTHNQCPDILVCETFLTNSVSDEQFKLEGFDLIRKDRSETQNKTGGGIMLYFRKSINCTRRCKIEASNIETLWVEISVPNVKPFFICTVYRPLSSNSKWVDQFEKELSIAQATGLEAKLMDDFNIDVTVHSNIKWQHLIDLFDLSQMIREPTRVTETTSTIIDHVYTSHPDNIIESFVSPYSISDHFPVCFTRKISNRISKSNHVTIY